MPSLSLDQSSGRQSRRVESCCSSHTRHVTRQTDVRRHRTAATVTVHTATLHQHHGTATYVRRLAYRNLDTRARACPLLATLSATLSELRTRACVHTPHTRTRTRGGHSRAMTHEQHFTASRRTGAALGRTLLRVGRPVTAAAPPPRLPSTPSLGRLQLRAWPPSEGCMPSEGRRGGFTG